MISSYHRGTMPDPASPTTPLFVRLPHREAELLARAAFARRVSKRELVTSLVQRALGEPEPLVVHADSLARGRHAFHPAPAPEVLTLAQAAELLQLVEPELDELAEAGGLPARKLGGEWRFGRAALLAWLAAGEAPAA